MARDFFINGPTMVSVKGRSDSAIANLTELGLSETAIRVQLDFKHMPIQVDAWGGQIPPELQMMLASASLTINLVHFDRAVLDECLRLSMAGAPAIGQLPRAGARMGNNLARFAPGGVAGNHYIGLNLTSPVGAKPWRFFFSYMTGPAMNFPVGAERSVAVVNWNVVPFSQDPYGAGTSSQGQALWDYGSD